MLRTNLVHLTGSWLLFRCRLPAIGDMLSRIERKKVIRIEKNLLRFGLLDENEENLISPVLTRLTGSRSSRLPATPQTVSHTLGTSASRVHSKNVFGVA